jgi:hypothetical protein
MGLLKRTSLALGVVAVLALGAGCTSDADVAAQNVSKAAEQFEVERQIVFYNGITGEYIAEIVGLCSVETPGNKVFTICKVGPGQYIKNYLGLSDNVTWFALQTTPVRVSDSHYRIVFKPSVVVPDFDLR